MRAFTAARFFLTIAAIWLASLLPANAQKTNAQIAAEIAVLFPDNVSGLITPLALRTVTLDLNDAASQFQVANFNIPMGRGAGVVGFTALAPGTSGQCLTSNGPAVAPSFQLCPSVFTGVLPNNTSIQARNAANNANLNILKVDTLDALILGESITSNTNIMSRLTVGSNTNNGLGTAVITVARTFNQAATTGHGFNANTVYDIPGGASVNAYDVNDRINGSQSYGHMSSFQSFAIWNSSGILNNWFGVNLTPDIRAGTVSNVSYLFLVPPSVSGGSVGNIIGLEVGDMLAVTPTALDTTHAVRTSGLAQSRFAGPVFVTGTKGIMSANAIYSDVTVTARAANVGLTLTADDMNFGVVQRTGTLAGAVFDTTASATALIDGLYGCSRYSNALFKGKWFRFMNFANNTITIQAGAGVTLSGSMVIPTNTQADFMIRCTGIAGGAGDTVTLIRISL